MGRQRYSCGAARHFLSFRRQSYRYMTHVTEDAEHAQRAKNATEGEATDLRFVACIHTAGLTDTRHPRRTRSRRPVRLSYTAAQRTEEPRIASTQKHMAKNLSVRGPPAY